MAEGNASNLFQSARIADAYREFRPEYGQDVYDTIMDFCREGSSSCDFSLAVDIGCGSGQSAEPLSKHFAKVMGVDVSEAQISRAPKDVANLSFRVGTGEDLSFLETGTVNLVTAAQATHWLDVTKFYGEVERVLKPGGALVLYGYGMPALDNPTAQETLDYLYKDVLGKYWAPGRQDVEEHYRSYSLPFPGWRRNDSLKIVNSLTIDQFIGYLCSWSAYHRYIMDDPLNTTMPDVRERLMPVYQAGDYRKEAKLTVTWPIFMLMGHRPQS